MGTYKLIALINFKYILWDFIVELPGLMWGNAKLSVQSSCGHNNNEVLVSSSLAIQTWMAFLKIWCTISKSKNLSHFFHMFPCYYTATCKHDKRLVLHLLYANTRNKSQAERLSISVYLQCVQHSCQDTAHCMNTSNDVYDLLLYQPNICKIVMTKYYHETCNKISQIGSHKDQSSPFSKVSPLGKDHIERPLYRNHSPKSLPYST